jgi:predicted transcriptional regulator
MAAPETKIEVGVSLREALAEVGTAWKAAAAGAVVPPTDSICFIDWAALCATLTPKRYELIRHIRQEPADSIRALARALGRNFKNVHADVDALERLGLVQRDPETGKISTRLNQVSSVINFAA